MLDDETVLAGQEFERMVALMPRMMNDNDHAEARRRKENSLILCGVRTSPVMVKPPSATGARRGYVPTLYCLYYLGR